MIKSVGVNNISFKANLVVDKNLYTKIPAGTKENFIEDIVSDYQKILDIPVIQEITQGDTIELYCKKYPGYAIGIKYITDKFDEPIDSGIHTSKKIPDFDSKSFIFDFKTFIIIKSGIQQKMSESHDEAFARAVKALLGME